MADDQIDTSALDEFVFFGCVRVADLAYEQFFKRTAGLDVSGVVEFSTLNLIAHNPGVTSRQLCRALHVLPPNMVLLIKQCVRRGLVERRPHPDDHRAHALYLTPAGRLTNAQVEKALNQGDEALTGRLSPHERQQLLSFMQRLY